MRRSDSNDDPHYQREKEKYENPVASREYLMSLLKEHDKPLSFLDICNLVNAFDEEARIGIQRRLRAMEREGQVQFTKQKKYILQNREELIKGRIIGHRDGYGFLRPEDKSGEPHRILRFESGMMQPIEWLINVYRSLINSLSFL